MTLVSGEVARGSFFTAGDTTRHEGGERIADLLNSETGFFPFEVEGDQRAADGPVQSIPPDLGGDFRQRGGAGPWVRRGRRAGRCRSCCRTGAGSTRSCASPGPTGRDRLSDWTRQPEVFRYIESGDGDFIVNAAHIVAVTEVPGS